MGHFESFLVHKLPLAWPKLVPWGLLAEIYWPVLLTKGIGYMPKRNVTNVFRNGTYVNG